MFEEQRASAQAREAQGAVALLLAPAAWFARPIVGYLGVVAPAVSSCAASVA
jgi:hypothetical protein